MCSLYNLKRKALQCLMAGKQLLNFMDFLYGFCRQPTWNLHVTTSARVPHQSNIHTNNIMQEIVKRIITECGSGAQGESKASAFTKEKKHQGCQTLQQTFFLETPDHDPDTVTVHAHGNTDHQTISCHTSSGTRSSQSAMQAIQHSCAMSSNLHRATHLLAGEKLPESQLEPVTLCREQPLPQLSGSAVCKPQDVV